MLLPGFLIGGIGIGFVNAPLATTAVSTVRVERAGMASGINNTFRQVGIATGIAALGAIFAVEGRLAAHSRRGRSSTACTTSCSSAPALAAVGAVLARVLVRPQDFVASGPAAAEH